MNVRPNTVERGNTLKIMACPDNRLPTNGWRMMFELGGNGEFISRAITTLNSAGFWEVVYTPDETETLGPSLYRWQAKIQRVDSESTILESYPFDEGKVSVVDPLQSETDVTLEGLYKALNDVNKAIENFEDGVMHSNISIDGQSISLNSMSDLLTYRADVVTNITYMETGKVWRKVQL